jgi:hypothetical protein
MSDLAVPKYAIDLGVWKSKANRGKKDATAGKPTKAAGAAAKKKKRKPARSTKSKNDDDGDEGDEGGPAVDIASSAAADRVRDADDDDERAVFERICDGKNPNEYDMEDDFIASESDVDEVEPDALDVIDAEDASESEDGEGDSDEGDEGEASEPESDGKQEKAPKKKPKTTRKGESDDSDAEFPRLPISFRTNALAIIRSMIGRNAGIPAFRLWWESRSEAEQEKFVEFLSCTQLALLCKVCANIVQSKEDLDMMGTPMEGRLSTDSVRAEVRSAVGDETLYKFLDALAQH